MTTELIADFITSSPVLSSEVRVAAYLSYEFVRVTAQDGHTPVEMATYLLACHIHQMCAREWPGISLAEVAWVDVARPYVDGLFPVTG